MSIVPAEIADSHLHAQGRDLPAHVLPFCMLIGDLRPERLLTCRKPWTRMG